MGSGANESLSALRHLFQLANGEIDVRSDVTRSVSLGEQRKCCLQVYGSLG